MSKDDPYLSELDDLGELDGTEESTEGEEEPTRLDLPTPGGPDADTDTRLEMEDSGDEEAPSMDVLALSPDMPVQVVAVLGRKSVSVRDILGFRSGSIVELDKLPAEPVDLVAAGKVVAKGELVSVEGKLGVRILKLLK